ELTDEISEELSDSLVIDPEALMEAFAFNMDSEALMELLSSMSSSTGTDYESNLSSLGYVDFANPDEIDIYPTDFDAKEEVVAILDNYNEQMEATGETDKVISYTDLVGTMMSSVTTIINVISYVLIAFVAISLIVSCIMISIITQISVMERTKEIGILRAIGASRRNISQVFNAETFIIGISSGLIGVVASELLTIPINALIHSLAGSTNVNAVLPVSYALLLVLVSIVITVLSGLAPAHSAAKKDPVIALRTE
ncbi:MAG: FtsX-like permease family protein, partial [Lachnospiraceae bacterium]|nr:FtsX-like permease family protein [Lachnospiraceae bacterium]